MHFNTILQFFDAHSLYTITLVLSVLIIGLVFGCYFAALSKLDQNKKSYEEISKRIEENKNANISGEKETSDSIQKRFIANPTRKRFRPKEQ